MGKCRTLGENPLDAVIPRPERPAPPPELEERPEPTLEEAAPSGSPTPSASPPPPEPAEAPEPAATPSPEPPPTTAPEGQYLTFFLGGEEYATSILRAKEIIVYESITSVPTTPPWIRGVMNLRGSVVPVIDLAVKFGLPETSLGDQTCIIVVEVALEDEKTVMGIMADAVSQVVTLGAEDIEPPPTFGTRAHTSFLSGMGKRDESFVLILDVDRVLSADELLSADTAPEPATGEEEAAGQASESEAPAAAPGDPSGDPAEDPASIESAQQHPRA